MCGRAARSRLTRVLCVVCVLSPAGQYSQSTAMPQLARSSVSRSFAFRTFGMVYRLRELRPTPAPWCRPCALEDSEHSTWLGRPQRARATVASCMERLRRFSMAAGRVLQGILAVCRLVLREVTAVRSLALPSLFPLVRHRVLRVPNCPLHGPHPLGTHTCSDVRAMRVRAWPLLVAVHYVTRLVRPRGPCPGYARAQCPCRAEAIPQSAALCSVLDGLARTTRCRRPQAGDTAALQEERESAGNAPFTLRRSQALTRARAPHALCTALRHGAHAPAATHRLRLMRRRRRRATRGLTSSHSLSCRCVVLPTVMKGR